MKKTLVVLLALMMVFAFATTAMAADEQYVPYNDIADQDVEIQTAIERLTILGALTGYDTEGTKFAPSQLITREEFATIGVRIAGLEDQVALYASMASAFTDVEEGRWSEGYINAANANGIMIGRGNGVFDPKANVTMQEVTTVLLRAVGYDDRLPGAWPSDYNTKAVNIGLTEYVDYIGPKAATRAEVASMANEALDLWMVQYVDDTTGLAPILGDVDKDGYMYITDMTNEFDLAGNRINLLAKTFDAYTDSVTFWDNNNGNIYGEAMGWGFEDFADWELISYVINERGNKAEGPEFAALYGISKGMDVTDLAWNEAILTLSIADDEIMYVDITSDVVRTADATTDQEDDATAADLGTDIAEGGYGEIWYDGNNAYASKDFSAFEGRAFGIVDDVDEDEVYFKNYPAFADLDLRDDYAFYLDGEGFIDAADLEEGDVIYIAASLEGADGLALVYRPVDATLDDLARNSIEIDDVVYGAIATSLFSYDQGNNFEDYDYDRIIDLELDFSDSVAFVPAYAFAKFAYFTDDLQHAGAGIVENYVISNGGHRLDNAGEAREVSGMYVLFAGDDEPTLVEFDSVVDAIDVYNIYPVEGSYVEYTLNADGELMVSENATYANDDVIFGDEQYKDEVISGEWTASNRLALNATGLDDVYRLASNAVIYLVDSEDATANPEVYDFDTAQALTAEEFEALGDFTADGLEIISANGTTISALYIRDASFIGDIVYGAGIYEGDGVIQSRSDRFYINLNGERIFIDDAVADEIEDYLTANADDGAFVAYKTEGGKIVDVADIVAVDDATDVDPFKDNQQDWIKDTGLELIAASVNLPDGYSNREAQIDIDNITNYTAADIDGVNTLWVDANSYVNGYDLSTGKTIAMSDLRDVIADNDVIIAVYVPGTNDLVYLLVK